MQRLKALFDKKRSVGAPKTNRRPLPSDPDFDVHAWLRESIEIAEKSPERLDPCAPTDIGLLLGFSDFVTPEQDAEQNHRSAEWERQQEEAKRSPATPQRRAS